MTINKLGRPLSKDGRKIVVSVYLTPEQIAKIDKMKKKESRCKFVREVINELNNK